MRPTRTLPQPKQTVSVWLKIIVASSCILLLLLAVGRGTAAEPELDTTTITVRSEVARSNVKRLGVNIGSHDRFGASQLLRNVVVNPGFEAGEYAMIFHTASGATTGQVQQDNWDAATWTNDAAKIGHPAGFWDGASYDVLTGNEAGRSGTISSFTLADSNVVPSPPDNRPKPDYAKLNTYRFDVAETALITGSAVVVRQELEGNAIEQFDIDATVDADESRPGSPGTQSLRLGKRDVGFKPSWRYYFDTLQTVVPAAGEMVTVEGEWCIDVWAKAELPADLFSVYFWRQGTGDFYLDSRDDGDEILTTNWRKYSFRSESIDPSTIQPARGGVVNADLPVQSMAELMGLPPILELGVRVGLENEGDIWIDDIALYRCDETNPTVFTDKYVDLLKELNPGILRNWGAQLGSTLDNQLADDFGRKTNGYRPHDRSARQWHYGLHDFLELAQEVGAEPWYVIPPSFTDEEMANLAAYLSAPASAHPYGDLRATHGQVEPWTAVFRTIHLEYGNEMWGANSGGDPFIGATARGGAQLGEMAEAKLSIFNGSRWVDSADFNMIVGGQVGNPYTVREIVESSDEQDSVAIAPYFGYDIAYADDEEELYYPAYARLLQDVGASSFVDEMYGHIDEYGQNEDLAIYEINFHATSGTASAAERNNYVSGLNGALALPLYMLTYQKQAGVLNQAAFQSAQYAFKFGNGSSDFANMWGMMRDIEATGRKRPTWLGVELANRAVMGNMLQTVHSGDNPTYLQRPLDNMAKQDRLNANVTLPLVHSFAFQDANKSAIVVFNLSLTESQNIVLDLDIAAANNAVLHQLNRFTGNSPLYEIDDNNESAENVQLRSVQITNFSPDYTFRMPPNSIYVYEWSTQSVYLPIVGGQ